VIYKFIFHPSVQAKKTEELLRQIDKEGYVLEKRSCGFIYKFRKRKESEKPGEYLCIYNHPHTFPMTEIILDLKNKPYLSKSVQQGSLLTPEIFYTKSEADLAEIRYRRDHKLKQIFHGNIITSLIIFFAVSVLTAIAFLFQPQSAPVLAMLSLIIGVLTAYQITGYVMLKRRSTSYYLAEQDSTAVLDGALDYCIVSTDILSGEAPVSLAVREKPQKNAEYPDSGWRFFSKDALKTGKVKSNELTRATLLSIVKLDSAIIDILNSNIGCSFGKDGDSYSPVAKKDIIIASSPLISIRKRVKDVFKDINVQ